MSDVNELIANYLSLTEACGENEDKWTIHCIASSIRKRYAGL